jgi:hypothetical protein
VIVWCRWCWVTFDDLDDCAAHQETCDAIPVGVPREPRDTTVWPPLRIRDRRS